MSNLMVSKGITGTTKFRLGLKISPINLQQLMGEFKGDYPTKSTGFTLKMFSENGKKGLEIGTDYISFFPEIKDRHEIEEIKKRIYKHIAKKSKIYYKTANENLDLAIDSLLSNNIRSSSSLLYYAFHKYMNSLMYRYLCDDIGMEEFEIDIKELAHFTSGNYYLSIINSNASDEINQHNYKESLCSTSDRVNPFLLMKMIASKEFENKNLLFDPYVNLIASKIFKIKELKKELSLLESVVSNHKEARKIKESYSAEDEINASIAQCLINYSEAIGEEKLLNSIYILTLRMYWLRQTADYEFDFEVKTSLRELVLSLFLVKEIIQQDDLSEKENKTKDDNVVNEEFEKKELISETIDDYKNDSENNIISFYNTYLPFPLKDKIHQSPNLYLSAIHFTDDFDKNEIFEALNFMENVSNKGTHFVYRNKKESLIPINLFVDDDGRWTVWISENLNPIKSFTPSDVESVFEKFVTKLEEKLTKARLNKIISTRAIYNNKQEKSFSLNGTLDLLDAFSFRKNIFLNQLVNKISNELKLSTNKKNEIIINDRRLKINFLFDSNLPQNSFYPMKYILNDDYQDKMFLNVFILDEREIEDSKKKEVMMGKIYHFESLIMEKYAKYFGNILDPDCIPLVMLSTEALQDFINDFDSSVVLEEILQGINDMVFEMNNRYINFTTSKILLQKCLNYNDSNPFFHATLGMWYLRNYEIELDEAEEMGNKFYEKSLELDKLREEPLGLKLKQRYYYELALFNLKRKESKESAKQYLIEGYNLGDIHCLNDFKVLAEEYDLLEEIQNGYE